MVKLIEKIKNLSLYKTLERAFNDEVTKEDYILHTFLFWANIFLLLIAVLELLLRYHTNIIFHTHNIEIIFACIFLIELILRLFFSYLQNSVVFKWSLLLQFLIIISLFIPIFGNLALLRILRSLNILNLYSLWIKKQKLKGEKVEEIKLPKFLHNINQKILSITHGSEKKINGFLFKTTKCDKN